jgi:hypothetical protein
MPRIIALSLCLLALTLTVAASANAAHGPTGGAPVAPAAAVDSPIATWHTTVTNSDSADKPGVPSAKFHLARPNLNMSAAAVAERAATGDYVCPGTEPCFP